MPIFLSLVGEQPLPVLLPILQAYADAQDVQVALAHTTRTARVARNVQQVIREKIGLTAALWLIDPYHISDIRTALRQHIHARQWPADQIVYNLTGSTKAMMLAAYELARTAAAQYVYLESERNESILYRYTTVDGECRLLDNPTLPALLDIHDYLHVHGFYDFRPSPPDHSSFFAAVRTEVEDLKNKGVLHQFKPEVDLHGNRQIDIDLMLRLGNQVAIAEVKSGNRVNSLEWIKQLNTASRPTTLGTYTKRLGILSRHLEPQFRDIASIQGIDFVVLEGFEPTGVLSAADRVKLREALQALFKPTSPSPESSHK